MFAGPAVSGWDLKNGIVANSLNRFWNLIRTTGYKIIRGKLRTQSPLPKGFANSRQGRLRLVNVEGRGVWFSYLLLYAWFQVKPNAVIK